MRLFVVSSLVLASVTPHLAFAEESAPPPPATVAPPAAPAGGSIELTSLRLMREKGIINEAEYQSVVKSMADSVGAKAGDSLTLTAGKWSTTFYGFVETDGIYDSTQSFNDSAGTNLVLRGAAAPQLPITNPQTYPGDNGRAQMSIRNSRLGMVVRAPRVGDAKTTGVLEMDFLGYEPSIPTSTEASYFNSPTMRVRHAYAKIENPYVNVLFGQTWHLFGWQEAYQPNTVEIQGLPGELYARTAQLRLSHPFETDPVNIEIAVAALRPPQRNSIMPDLTAGVRVTLNQWRGVHTAGGTGTGIVPASIAFTGDMRNFKLPQFEALPNSALKLTTGSVADLYSGMTAGLTFPTIPVGNTGQQGVVWPQDVDNGLVVYDNNPPMSAGAPSTASLHPILWETLLGGVEYYLPGLDGHVWLSGNASIMKSPNIADYTQPQQGSSSSSNYTLAGQVRTKEIWWDANLFYDPLPFVRVGAEFAVFYDTYADGYEAINRRAQLSGWFRF